MSSGIATAGGYKRRNTLWQGEISQDKLAIVPLQFFEGNDYHVVLGVAGSIDDVVLTAFDSAGRVMPLVPDSRDGRLILRVRPKVSGAHYIRIRLRENVSSAYCAMTYLYR